MLAAAFAVLTDRREVNVEKAKGNIFCIDRPPQLIRALLPYA